MALQPAFALPVALRSSSLLSRTLSSRSPHTRVRIQIRTRTDSTIVATQQKAVQESPQASTERQADKNHKLVLLFDGECPLCVKEVNFLQKRVDKMAPLPTIKFVDIASAEYSAEENGGIDYETAMGRIHGITENDEVLVGVPVFRKAYEAVGLGWVYAATSLPGVGAAADFVYNIWADYRLQLTGRPPLEQVMKMKRSDAERTCR